MAAAKATKIDPRSPGQKGGKILTMVVIAWNEQIDPIIKFC